MTALDQQTRAKLSGPTLLAFLEATSDWRCTDEEERAIAGYPPAEQFDAWSMAALEGDPLCLGEDRLIRLGAITNVHRRIRYLLPRREDRIGWLRKPSRGPACKGRSPLEIMSKPDDMPIIIFRQDIDRWMQLPGIPGLSVIRVGDAF